MFKNSLIAITLLFSSILFACSSEAPAPEGGTETTQTSKPEVAKPSKPKATQPSQSFMNSKIKVALPDIIEKQYDGDNNFDITVQEFIGGLDNLTSKNWKNISDKKWILKGKSVDEMTGQTSTMDILFIQGTKQAILSRVIFNGQESNYADNLQFVTQIYAYVKGN